MSALSVQCPKCGRSLKLPDHRVLGKKGKCLRCGHRFVLTAPASSEPKAPAAPKAPATPKTRAAPTDSEPRRARPPQPQVGTSARWIPDEPATAADESLPVFPLAEDAAAAASAERPPLPTKLPVDGVAPPAATTSPDASVAAGSVAAGEGAGSAAASDSPAAFDFAAANAPPLVVDPADEGEAPATARLTRRRRRRTWMPHVVLGVFTLIAAGVTAAAVFLNRPPDASPSAATPPAANPQWEQQQRSQAAANERAVALSPTDGDEIPLAWVPFTPHLLCHLRPADLWERDRPRAEFRATLGDLSLWLQDHIRQMGRFEPQDIEELTFAVNFGPRTSRPDVAAVVRLREPQTQSDLFRRFDGQLRPDLEGQIYESGDLCFLLIDERTFAVAPTNLVDSLVAAREYPALPPADLEPLLRASDRQRHVTLLFDVDNIDTHREYIFRSELQTLADQFVIWMGKDIETVSWSLHLEPHLYMETLLRQANDSSPLKVKRHMRLQLDRLPEQMLDLARLMRPGTEGSRLMVGRFPAMLQAVSLATTVDVAGQYVRCVTMLPENAAANLAAASLLTWNQSVVTDFSAAVPVQETPSLPDTVAERLELPVLVDFRNTPLQEVVEYIGDELKVEFVIDGDALKNAGFTQNMPQSFDLGTVSAKTALHAVLKQYAEERDPMVITVDEDAKRITLTTQAQVARDGTPVFSTAP